MNLSLKFFLISIVIFISNYYTVLSDDIILRYADSLVGRNIEEISYREFFGNVWFTQKDLDLKCNYAKHYITANSVDLVGNVVITQRSMVIKAPKIFYNGNSGIALAKDSIAMRDGSNYLESLRGTYSTKQLVADFVGEVFVEDDSVTIYCDNVMHYRESSESFASGDVWVFGKFTNVILRGDEVVNIPKDSYSIATGNPILFKIDTLSRVDSIFVEQEQRFISTNIISFDTLSIKADTMQSYRWVGDEQYYFDGNVQIAKDDIKAIAERAVYYKDKDLIILRNKPVVWYDSTQLFSDSIAIRLENNSLRQIRAFGNSIALTKVDSIDYERINQISAKDIIIDFEDGKISGLWANVNASSLYFFKDDEGYNGVDRKSTDSIYVEFVDGEVENIYWLGSSVAEFYPENIIIGRITSYYLPDFKWYDEKPEKQKILFARRYKESRF